MYLATDYIHPYRGVIGVRSRCRIRLYLPQEDRDAAVVICSELPDNPGTSVVDAAEQIAAEIIQHFRLPSPPVWIEHRPQEEPAGGQEEAFDLVILSPRGESHPAGREYAPGDRPAYSEAAGPCLRRVAGRARGVAKVYAPLEV